MIDDSAGSDPGGQRGDIPLLARIAEGLAVLGGIIVIGMALMTVFGISWRSIVGRGLRGDFEIVELLSAYAVFLFFPYAQVVRQHVAVDFVASFLPRTWQVVTEKCSDLAVVVVSAFVTWRVTAGAFDAHAHDEMTMMLRLPMVWAYIPAILGWAAMTLVALWQLAGRMPEVEKP